MGSLYRPGVLGLFVSLAIFAGNAASAEGAKPSDFEALVASPDRSDADRQTDQRRRRSIRCRVPRSGFSETGRS